MSAIRPRRRTAGRRGRRRLLLRSRGRGGARRPSALGALPMDRDSTGRKSADQIRELLAEGWSLLIYPEGGR